MLVLRSSPASPFGRKVKIAAIELGLMDRIEVVAADTSDPSEVLRQQNPLGKIPTLVLEDGTTLFEVAPGELSGHIAPSGGSLAGAVGIRPQAGDGRLEQQIHEQIASYGRQLGLLTEAVLGLAGSEQVGPEHAGRSLARLEEIRAEVEALKTQQDTQLARDAAAVLEQLAARDPAALAALVRRFGAPRLPASKENA